MFGKRDLRGVVVMVWWGGREIEGYGSGFGMMGGNMGRRWSRWRVCVGLVGVFGRVGLGF